MLSNDWQVVKEAKGRGLMVQEQERVLMPRGLRPVAIEGVCYGCLLLACKTGVGWQVVRGI